MLLFAFLRNRTNGQPGSIFEYQPYHNDMKDKDTFRLQYDGFACNCTCISKLWSNGTICKELFKMYWWKRRKRSGGRRCLAHSNIRKQLPPDGNEWLEIWDNALENARDFVEEVIVIDCDDLHEALRQHLSMVGFCKHCFAIYMLY